MDYLQQHPGLFFGLTAVMFAFTLVNFYRRGRAAEQIFENGQSQQVRFRERGVSGYSNKSPLTRVGGARRALEVVVTDSEVWIKGVWPAFSYIGTQFDLAHRIPRNRIRSVVAHDEVVDLRFQNEAGAESHLVLTLKSPREFIAVTSG